MKHYRYDDEVAGELHMGGPPLPADAIYRQEQQSAEKFNELDDLEPLGNSEVIKPPAPADLEESSPDSKVEADDQAGDDENTYHPIMLLLEKAIL